MGGGKQGGEREREGEGNVYSNDMLHTKGRSVGIPTIKQTSEFHLASCTRSSFSMLHTEKQEGLASKVT